MATSQRSVTRNEPTTEPLSLQEAKKHLEIPEDDPTHDSHVSGLIVAAREVWEHDTQSATTQRTYVEHLDAWPDKDWRFYYRPIVSVTDVKYFDESNVEQTLASSVYSLDIPNRRLLLAYEQSWPSIVSRWDAIKITYVAGQSVVREIVKSAMKLKLDVLFELRGATKNKDACEKAYENLVRKYMRSSYP